MNDLTKVLWIEEETKTILTDRIGYLNSLLEYDINILETFTEGINEIQNWQQYRVIIIDIRIPEGDIQNISELEKKRIYHYGRKRGLRVIEELAMFGKEALARVMIYTNESWEDVQDRFEKLGNNKDLFLKKIQFLQKKDCRSNQMFDGRIKEIIKRTFEHHL